MDVAKYNSQAWDHEAAIGNIWTQPVSGETVAKARQGVWEIVLTPTKPVPRNWFRAPGNRVLGLASGGGQQGPILAAAGYEVTILDNSEKQLAGDRLVAEREGLNIRTVRGDMRDLSMFADEQFDLIVHPVSNVFVESVLPVWREAYRVLKKGGALLSGFENPVIFIFDWEEMDAGRLHVTKSIPYSPLESLSSAERDALIRKNETLEFGHTLEDQIKGQLDAGFVLTGFYEDIGGDGNVLDRHIASFAATRAEK